MFRLDKYLKIANLYIYKKKPDRFLLQIVIIDSIGGKKISTSQMNHINKELINTV